MVEIKDTGMELAPYRKIKEVTMIYDCFQFFNELDILNLRLHIMSPIVDKFVISEATTTFSGLPKPLYYEENKDEKRINTDEMVARIGSWKDSTLQLKCAREAVKLIKEYIEKGMSFNQETTL